MSDGLLLIIDPQNDFTNQKGYYAQHHPICQIEAAKQRINLLLKKWDASKVIIVYSDYHFGQFKEGVGFGIPHTFGHEMDADFSFTSLNNYFVKKEHSAFSSIAFERFIQSNKSQPLIVCGFLVEYCVAQTVMDGLKKQLNLVVLEDGIGTGDDVCYRKKITLDELCAKGAVISNSSIYINS